jgi:phage-related baseplate assembly protein
VTVTNAAAFVGTDEETDVDLKVRCVAKLGSLSPNGARDAYNFIARSATRADGSPIGITRVRTIPDGIGGVDVYLATPSGGVTGTSGDPLTDLGAVAAAIWETTEPLAVEATVASATKITGMDRRVVTINETNMSIRPPK